MPKILFDPGAIAAATPGSAPKITFPERQVTSKSVIHVAVLNFAKKTLVSEGMSFIPTRVRLERP